MLLDFCTFHYITSTGMMGTGAGLVELVVVVYPVFDVVVFSWC